ncbi:transglycosylase domain-containing protein [Streptomyces sp. NPDC088745]|uniref:transglycosylase domain-containing protein n=1 Tax=Streptomyces sp. NPDC088745 TaxID=3365884 RepID=UPI00382DDAD0
MTKHDSLDRATQAVRAALAPGRGRRKRTGTRSARLRLRLPGRPDYPRPGRHGWQRWVPSWRHVLGTAVVFVGLLTATVAIAYARTEIPDDLNAFATQQDNVYYWADGTPMARTGWVSRQEMSLEKVPEHVRGAVLAAENHSFYSDPGVSFQGVTRAFWRTVSGGDTQGGSTITQQYVKNVYLSQDRSFSRKFTEMLMAIKLDRQRTKDQILEDYLNTSWFGRGSYGLQRAAQAYYGKEVTQLNASEGAFLAALLKGAALYDPTLGPENRERAVERWKWTLDRMVEVGGLSRSERARYTAFPEPRAAPRTTSASGQDGYLVALAESYAKRTGKIPDAAFDLGGYQIYTTFDKRRTTALTAAVRKSRDSLDPTARADDRHTKFGAATIAPDGRILAVHGGPDFQRQAFNESNTATVPAGSSFTPFVYAAALEHGVRRGRTGPRTPVTPWTLYDGNDDVPLMTPEGPYWDRGGKMVKGRNDGGRSYGRIPLRDALARGVHTPLLQLGMDVGLDLVRSTAQKSGMLAANFGPPVPAFSLGNSTPSAIRTASAYGVFAGGGRHTDPYSVRRITRNGEPVPLPRPRSTRALSPAVADRVTEALTRPGDDFAGQTGTTPDDTARWYVGSTEEASTAVVVYRMDLTKSLAPLPLKALGRNPAAARRMPAEIWDRYTAALRR